MKLIPAILLILLCHTVSAQVKRDSLALIQLLKDDYKTLPIQDAKSHIANCTADFMLIEKGEFMDMKREIETFYTPNTGPAILRTDSFTIKKITVLGTTAYAAYILKSDIKRGDQQRVLEWNESAVFRKENGRWKIALVHSTPVIKEPK